MRRHPGYLTLDAGPVSKKPHQMGSMLCRLRKKILSWQKLQKDINLGVANWWIGESVDYVVWFLRCEWLKGRSVWWHGNCRNKCVMAVVPLTAPGRRAPPSSSSWCSLSRRGACMLVSTSPDWTLASPPTPRSNARRSSSRWCPTVQRPKNGWQWGRQRARLHAVPLQILHAPHRT